MVNWEMQDKGWHTSELGGVADEGSRKWYFYPVDDQPRHGPFGTMKEAVNKAEALNKRHSAAIVRS